MICCLKLKRNTHNGENSNWAEYLEGIQKHSQDLIKRFVEKGYNESTVRKQIERVEHLDRSLLLKLSVAKHKGNNK